MSRTTIICWVVGSALALGSLGLLLAIAVAWVLGLSD